MEVKSKVVLAKDFNLVYIMDGIKKDVKALCEDTKRLKEDVKELKQLLEQLSKGK